MNIRLKPQRIYSRDGSEFGIVVGRLPDYTGEAGRSGRVKVLWKDGTETYCNLKGMRAYKESKDLQII